MAIQKDAVTIRNAYRKISHRYDFVNRLLSLGLDRSWRVEITQRVGLKSGQRALDSAAGTLDVAIELKSASPQDAQVVALDLSMEMLEFGMKKSYPVGGRHG